MAFGIGKFLRSLGLAVVIGVFLYILGVVAGSIISFGTLSATQLGELLAIIGLSGIVLYDGLADLEPNNNGKGQ